jgi:ABC-type glycerol-3-phosphate transport system substrate-binding protein
MNQKLSAFQIIIFGVLIVAIIAGVIMFAVQKNSNKKMAVAVDIWGTVSADSMDELNTYINEKEEDSIDIIYTEFTEAEFESSLIEALASGEGPDAVILPDNLLIKHENKLFSLNYEFYPQKQFQDSFIEAGEILMRETGILGFPLTVDPLVLYYNRTILNNEAVATPPQFWDQFLDLVPKIVVGDSASNISRAAVAMGEFQNINNAKEILISLIQQAGNSIVVRDVASGSSGEKVFQSTLAQRMGFKLRPADTAINFFIQFANPAKDVYSWNRSLKNSQNMFLAGDLAFYFGFASELDDLKERNPNLNFGISQLPQSRSSAEKTAFGRMSFISILNASDDIQSAFLTLNKITEPDNAAFLADLLKLPPVRREVLTEVPDSAEKDVLNASALIVKPFIDPNKLATHNILQTMIESAVVGVSSISSAVDRANAELNALLQ